MYPRRSGMWQVVLCLQILRWFTVIVALVLFVSKWIARYHNIDEPLLDLSVVMAVFIVLGTWPILVSFEVRSRLLALQDDQFFPPNSAN